MAGRHIITPIGWISSCLVGARNGAIRVKEGHKEASEMGDRPYGYVYWVP